MLTLPRYEPWSSPEHPRQCGTAQVTGHGGCLRMHTGRLHPGWRRVVVSVGSGKHGS